MIRCRNIFCCERSDILFDYTGYKCESCGEKFGRDDDIVVCPECGTPYHRSCWQKEGRCINTELHESNVSWKTDMESKSESTEDVRCRNCGRELRGDQLFCDNCGAPTDFYLKSKGFAIRDKSDGMDANGSDTMAQTIYPYMINYSDPLCGFNPEEEFGDGLTMKDMGDFVGTSTHYYLPKFKLMKTGKFKVSMNIPALFFPEMYFAYRKMPLTALFLMIVKTVISIPSMAVSLQMMLADKTFYDMFIFAFPSLSDAVQKVIDVNFNTGTFNMLYNFASVLNWAVIIVFSLFSNYMYYKHALKKAAEVKQNALKGGMNCSEQLKINGGASVPMLILFIVLYFFITNAATMSIFFIV